MPLKCSIVLVTEHHIDLYLCFQVFGHLIDFSVRNLLPKPLFKTTIVLFASSKPLKPVNSLCVLASSCCLTNDHKQCFKQHKCSSLAFL